MLSDFGYIGIFLVAALAFTASMILIPVTLRLLRIVPRKPSPTKASPFECGMETSGRTWVQFNFRYYFFALLFVIFDIQVVFLYPWAVEFGHLRVFGLVEMLAFFLILAVGFVYAWRKGVLRWR